MRFSWLTLGLSPSPDGDYAAIREQLSQGCFAETANFNGIWLTEHKFTGESVYCDPIPLPAWWPRARRAEVPLIAVLLT